MAEIKRKKGESFEGLIRRFNKKLQQSGLLIQSRKIRFYEKDKSRTRLKDAALRRMKIGAKREYLKKIGKLPEDR
ncbi:MAG: 30S ribosomal protein S21 [Candidatus Buchananbacteria bacterium]|nr:30S ribosomal protein S21 [Candidatus Buchananbacteria bacterium]